MIFSLRRYLAVAALLGVVLGLHWSEGKGQTQAATSPLVVGIIRDHQFQPVEGAVVTLVTDVTEDPLTEAVSQSNGRFALVLVESDIQNSPEGEKNSTGLIIDIPDQLNVHIERPHFAESLIHLTPQQVQQLKNGETIVLPDITVHRIINAAFWIASLIFLGVLAIIATGKLHNTLAALVGVALIFIISYLGTPLNENLFIFDFNVSLSSYRLERDFPDHGHDDRHRGS